MLRTVRKSISATQAGMAIFTLTAFSASVVAISSPLSAWAQKAQAKPAVTEVKKLDDGNKEVLRPIPAVLKTPAQAQPKDKETAARDGGSKEAAGKVSAGKDPAVKVGVGKSRTDIGTASTRDKSPTAPKSPETAKNSPETGKTDSKKATAGAPSSTRTAKRSASAGSHFVPPPPPITPSMMGDASDFALYGGMPVELLSKEALKDRAKELSIQYKDASQELANVSREKEEKIARAKEFEGLFQEGVVSKRELETSQREAGSVNSDIDRLTMKTNELKSLLERVNKRLASRQPQRIVKKPGHN